MEYRVHSNGRCQRQNRLFSHNENKNPKTAHYKNGPYIIYENYTERAFHVLGGM